ncbi:MAG: TonB-dependent receptor [Turneriella sp.]
MRNIFVKSFMALLLTSGSLWVQNTEKDIPAKDKKTVAEPKKENNTIASPAVNAEAAKPAEAPVTPAAKSEEQRLPDVVVTASREEEQRRDLPISIGVLRPDTIKDVKPIHPSEIFNRVPGAFVATTSGEGHVTSIRQPISTNPFYLYLEDGIPTRATGFFNHNALYEVNIPQAGGVEIIKGPATALYGSDAVGGMINVLTKPVTRDRELDLSVEYGGFGWKRLLASVGEKWGENSMRVDANITDSKGWRDGTQFDRQAGTWRWDNDSGRNRFKALVSGANITQQSAGVAQIVQSDYDNNPQVNYMTTSYRKVQALRAHIRWDHDFSNMSTLSTTVFGRYNTMGLLPNYSGPNTAQQLQSDLRSASAGLMLKHSLKFNVFDSRLITGADLDYSPGAFKEWGLTGFTKNGNYFNNAYNVGPLRYDYNAVFYQASPYAQIETSPLTKNLHLNLGVRYDHMAYDYKDNLTYIAQSTSAYRPGDTSISYDHLSPKAGAVYDFVDELNVFTSYRHGYRIASQSELFRAGNLTNTVNLKPIKADSYEVGIRGSTFKDRIKYELTGYYMIKYDDFVNYFNPDGTTSKVNATSTQHQGVEIGLEAEIWKKYVFFSGNVTYAEHKYSSYSLVAASGTTVYDGKWMSLAPRVMSTLDLKVKPIKGAQIELEWVYLGDYFVEDTNTYSYPGHNFFNVRAKYEVNERFSVFTRIHNITNVRYSDYTTYQPSNSSGTSTPPAMGMMYTPGEPFSVIGGLSYQL